MSTSPTLIRPEMSISTWEQMLPGERKTAAEKLLRAIGEGGSDGYRARVTLACLADQAIKAVMTRDNLRSDLLSRNEHPGFFVAETAKDLLMEGDRLRGFYDAISHTQNKRVKRVVEVGSGPAAILAMFAALAHPHAEVETFEISKVSTNAARKILEIFGFDKQIVATTADALNHDIGEADLGITETFRPGLFLEPGVKVIDRLANLGVRHIIPDRIDMLYGIAGTNEYDPYKAPYYPQNIEWHKFQTVKAGDNTERIVGVIPRERVNPVKSLWVRSDYYAEGMPVLVGIEASNINEPTDISRLPQPPEGHPLNLGFSYKHSVDLRDADIQFDYC